jgi:transposase
MRRILGIAAFVVMDHKGTYLNARYHRLRGRIDSRKAQVTIMHEMAVAIWFSLHDKVPRRELGSDYFTRRDPAKIKRRTNPHPPQPDQQTHRTYVSGDQRTDRHQRRVW